MPDTKLLPCPNPWCLPHNGRYLLYEHSTTAQQRVSCACGLNGPYRDTREEAIAAWNERPALTPKQKAAAAEDERVLTQVMEERDEFERRLTVLAESVGHHFDVPVGEWSNANEPDYVALEILNGEYKTKYDAKQKAAEEMAKALAEAKEFIENQQLPDAEWSRVLDVLVAALAKAGQQ